jgi:putative glutamine amidotransferase
MAAGLPILAICRGHQELNVALGGTLHQQVHKVPGRIDHRSLGFTINDVAYGPAHPARVQPGGALAQILGPLVGADGEITVNSLHGQAIDRLAPGLMVEATAPDGTIEAVSAPGARSLVLGLQWHPEYNVLANPVGRAIFAAFGQAARTFAAHDHAPQHSARHNEQIAFQSASA